MEAFKACDFVIEAARENVDAKSEIFSALEAVVPRHAVIASNTSAIPITLLQHGRRRPERFIGMHWAEPAQIMQYLEIIPGAKTNARTIKLTRELGKFCGKEPTVLKQDIRGFLSNRMMYAMMREAFHLVESGIADIETVDRSFRNDIGWWATLAGPFRWMDLTGIPAYRDVMEGLLPELSQSTAVPKLMEKTVKRGARGISNGKGFYSYSKASSRKWEKAWVEFTYDVKKLAEKYQAVLS
jgi:3-hydroxybutyryl-CoA dehydrogenase